MMQYLFWVVNSAKLSSTRSLVLLYTFQHFSSKLSLPVPSIETFTKNKTNVDSIFRNVANHPVHIYDNHGNISPSSFIPYCEFGGKMSAMGVKKDQFKVPVCNSFKAKILHDQLCYDVDLDKFKRQNSHSNVNKLVSQLVS